jgi:hypothetical protein
MALRADLPAPASPCRGASRAVPTRPAPTGSNEEGFPSQRLLPGRLVAPRQGRYTTSPQKRKDQQPNRHSSRRSWHCRINDQYRLRGLVQPVATPLLLQDAQPRRLRRRVSRGPGRTGGMNTTGSEHGGPSDPDALSSEADNQCGWYEHTRRSEPLPTAQQVPTTQPSGRSGKAQTAPKRRPYCPPNPMPNQRSGRSGSNPAMTPPHCKPTSYPKALFDQMTLAHASQA